MSLQLCFQSTTALESAASVSPVARAGATSAVARTRPTPILAGSRTAPSSPAPRSIKLLLEVGRDGLEVHEVAEPTSGALAHLVLTTAGLSEVGDRRELGVDRGTVVPSIVQICDSLGGVFFLPKLDVHVADQVVTQVVANVHFLDLAVFILHLHEDVLEEVVIVLLEFHVRYHRGRIGRGRCILRVPVAVLQDYGLGEGGFVVKSRARSAVTTGTDLEVERTVDLVLLCPEDGCQVFGHFDPNPSEATPSIDCFLSLS